MPKILIIDDKRDNLLTTTAVIETARPNFTIITAQSGEEGLRVAKAEKPDTILLDINMPGMDGFEVCRRLKLDEDLQHIPVVFLTAVKTDLTNKIRGLDLGGDAYLYKPVDSEELIAQLEVMLRIKKAEDGLRLQSSILEQKVVERTNELQELNAKYLDSYENAPDMFGSVEADTSKILRCNKTLVKALGYKKHEIIGQPIFFVYHPDCLINAKKSFKLFVDTGEVHDAELQLKRKDGSKIDVSLNVTAVCDENGKVLYSRSIWRDITERKQAEEKKQLLADMLEIIPASITIHDFDGNFLYFNNRTLEIHGYTKDEFKSLNLHKLDTPTSEKLIAQRMQVLRETGEASFEAVHSRKDRSTVPVFVHVKRTKWKDKEVLLSVAIDITERKQAEAALTQSEERHRTLFETMAQGVVYQRADGHIISANPAAERILGLTLDQMLGRTSIDPRWKSIHEDGSDFPGDTHPAMVALRTKKEVRNEIMGVFHPDENEYVWININAIPNIKQPYQVYTTFEDITERKVAEGKIKRFSRIFEDSLNEIYLFNSETLKFIQVNNAAQQNLGYTMEELRNMTPLNFKPEFTLESFEKLITPLRKRKKGKINFETVHKRKDNSLYNVEVHLQLLKYEHEEIFAAIIMDITERKQAEEELQESELQYRTLGETIPYGVWTTDATGYCTYVSDSFIELVDMRLDQIQEFGWLHLLPPEDVEQTKEHWLDCVKTGKNFERVHSFRSKDGSYRNVLAIGRPIKDKNDKIRKWVGINLDITDRQQVAEERKQALKDAQNANNVKDLFLANMSHELRTPLNSLLGFTEIVEDSLKDRVSEEEAEFFQTIRHSGKRLIKTIHGVLDISQIETGTILFSQEIMPLAPTVEQLYKEFKPLAEAKKLKLTFDNQIDGGCIKADESLLIKAVSNIVENAIKYTDKGEIALKLIEQVGHYGLSISDTGIGMSADYMKHMYDTFTQESSGFTKKYQGLGLGLSIAKRCLDLMEIAIDVESKKGVGTTFKLTFKREEVDDDTLDKPVEAKPKVIEAIDIEKPMVLIVEDDKNNRKVLEVQLKPTYHTCYAVSVDGAMQQLKQHNVDLVLLDLALEGEATGLDLVAYMKTKDKLKDIPIIAVTAHTFTIDRENALNAGCDAYFSKPIKMMELKEMINEYCKK